MATILLWNGLPGQASSTGACNRLSRLEAHHNGLASRKRLLAVLKWQMPLAEDAAVMTFLTEFQENQQIAAGLVDEVTRLYTENVQHWDFPEEPGPSQALPMQP